MMRKAALQHNSSSVVTQQCLPSSQRLMQPQLPRAQRRSTKPASMAPCQPAQPSRVQPTLHACPESGPKLARLSAGALAALLPTLACALPAQAAAAAIAPHLPLAMLMSGGDDLWLQLGALIAANILGVQAVRALLKKLGDRDEPITLVKVQLGLVQPHGLFGGSSLKQLRTRLSELASMIQMGQHGLWVIVEEAVLELSAQHRCAQLADVAVIHLQSKGEAYDLFSQVSHHEIAKARAKEAAAHLLGEAVCEVDWEGAPGQHDNNTNSSSSSSHSAAGMASPLAAIQQWLTPEQHDAGCDDALVVTLVVAARGYLSTPASVSSWQGVCECMKEVCGLSSDRLMAVDITWAPSADGSYLTRDALVAEYAGLKPLKH